MRLMPFLEDFSAPPVANTPVPPLGWEDGYAAGFDAAHAQAAQTQTALSAQTAQALADLSFTFAEAQHVVLQQLHPLLQLIAARIVPDILRQTLGAALAEELAAAAAADSTSKIPLRLPPADCPALADIAGRIAGCTLQVIPDPELQSGQALIGGPGRSTAFDTTRLARDLADALNALCAEPPRTLAHG